MVLEAVVLDHDPTLGIGEIDASDERSRRVAHDVLGHGSSKPTRHECTGEQALGHSQGMASTTIASSGVKTLDS